MTNNDKSFEKYIESKYYDMIFSKIKTFVIQHKSLYSSRYIDTVITVESDDFHIEGISFKQTEDNRLNFRASILLDLLLQGKAKRDFESDSISAWVSAEFSAILNDGSLHDLKMMPVTDYSKERFDKESSLDHYLVPYLYSDNIDEVAEKFLKKYCPEALFSPVPVSVEKIVTAMGMKMFYAPLDDTVFGKTYFDSAVVEVYSDETWTKTRMIRVDAGTMLINPNVYFMRNIGTVNNTIIHECVHWERHRLFFELRKLLGEEYRYVSCEVVKLYGKEKTKATPLDWIEWQANVLAPKILMPANTVKRFIQDRMYNLRQTMPASTRDAEVLQQALEDTATYFKVSKLAAKIRAIELGFEQAHGIFVYIDDKTIPPFSFSSKLIGKNGGFVTSSINALCIITLNPTLNSLYNQHKIVFINNMLCLNAPKYISWNDDGFPEMTPYALDHVDECCFMFHYKKRSQLEYDDSYYRTCFLCRTISTDAFVETGYSTDEGTNKLTEDEANALAEIFSASAVISDTLDELPGSFPKTLDYHIKRRGFTAEELRVHSQISTQTLSELRNKKDKKVKFETLMKLFVGLHLSPFYCEDLMRKAKLDYPPGQEGLLWKWLVNEHTNESLTKWQLYLNHAGIQTKIYDPDFS